MLCTICCLSLVFSSCAQSKQRIDDFKLHLNKTKQFLNGLEEKGYSGQAYVLFKGEVLINKGYGFADRDQKVLNKSNTVFDIGSLTKLYTKAGIIKLIEKGNLKLEDSLEAIFTDVPDDKARITIQQLLDMSSGLPEYVPGAEQDFDFITKENAKKVILSHKLRFMPGSANEYSNSGYTMLAMIIEEKSKMSYQDFIVKYIIPNSIAKHGFYNDDHWEEDKVAIGYDMMSHSKKNSPVYWPKPSWGIMGAGGIVTSAEGVSQWLEAIKGGSVLDKKHTALFDKLQIKSRTQRGTTALIRAGGSSYGFTSAIADYPIEQLSIVVTSNTAKFDVSRHLFQNFLSWLIRGQEFEQVNVSNSRQNIGRNVSPKEGKLNEFLKILTEGDIKSYIKNNFSDNFINDMGLDSHVEFLETIREKEGSFNLLKILENRMGFLKVLVESKKTKEQYALAMKFLTSPPFNINSIGLEPFDEKNTEVIAEDSKDFSLVEKQLMKFIEALSSSETVLRKFIKDNFENDFLERYGGVEGHYNFLRNFDGGINNIKLLEVSNNTVEVSVKRKKNNQALKINLQISETDHKIASLGIRDLKK